MENKVRDAAISSSRGKTNGHFRVRVQNRKKNNVLRRSGGVSRGTPYTHARGACAHMLSLIDAYPYSSVATVTPVRLGDDSS